MTAALTFEKIAHQFDDVPVLRQVSFHVNCGDILCLLGPSGCGKTTALRIAAGLERPLDGRVLINGKSVADINTFVEPEARGVGLLFQDYALFPHLNVERNVLFGLKGLPAKEQRQRTKKWLQRLELWDRREAYPHMLSGGEQQRIALARALAPQPAVLLLDEPFSNLDSRLRMQVREDVLTTIKEIESGTAILMVTHDPEEALYMGDNIAVMESGQILQQGSPTELYTQPATPSIATFFGDVNQFHAKVTAQSITCPLGKFPVGQFAEGTEVDVMIRTEGINIVDAKSAGLVSHGIVKKIRRLGQINRIEVECPGEAGQQYLLKVDVLGPAKFQPGEKITLQTNPDLIYCYPTNPNENC